jgi:hypothetical protein
MAPHNYNTNKQSATKRVKKTAHSRSYPRGVGLDFRKLAGLTLQSFIDYHGKFTYYNIQDLLRGTILI